MEDNPVKRVQTVDRVPTISLQASGFPLSAFKEWDESCRKDFGNARWVKIIHDHQLAKTLPLFNTMLTRIELLEKYVAQIGQSEQNDDNEEIQTLGGEMK